MACLGSILLKNSLIDNIFSRVSADEFYDGRNRSIARLIHEHREKRGHEPIDSLTLTDRLRMGNKLQEVGGAEYISGLIANVPTTSNAEHYAKIIHEKSILRRIIEGSYATVDEACDEQKEVGDIMDRAQQRLFEIVREEYRDFKDFYTILKESFQVIEEIHKNRGKSIGVETGFTKLDDVITGFQPSNLIIIGGRPSMGKTAFALSIVQNISIRGSEPIPVGFFSLEMSHYELCLRLLSAESEVPMEKIRKGALIDTDWPLLIQAANHMRETPIYIDDSPNLTMLELAAKARQMVKLGVRLIVLDYLQLIGGQEANRNYSREQFISSISRGLKMLAKELNIPIVAISQLSRAPEQRGEHRPQLSDLRESGAIEQDADIVCFVHRQWVYEESKDEPREEIRNKGEVIVKKNRQGRTGKVTLYFHDAYPRFDNFTEEYSQK